jgi:hypothetical protein
MFEERLYKLKNNLGEHWVIAKLCTLVLSIVLNILFVLVKCVSDLMVDLSDHALDDCGPSPHS